MISEKFKREEEILTTVYPAGSTNDISPGSYKFLLGFASRQVTEIALKHVQVKVLPIDGINPLTDINSIYNGNYPFGRKIHLLLPDNNSTEETQLATFLQSSQWQILIASIGYLPASPKR
jgi:ABC-type phosphate transport system substrate-binding protein